jgi:hypothetical protein
MCFSHNRAWSYQLNEVLGVELPHASLDIDCGLCFRQQIAAPINQPRIASCNTDLLVLLHKPGLPLKPNREHQIICVKSYYQFILRSFQALIYCNADTPIVLARHNDSPVSAGEGCQNVK